MAMRRSHPDNERPEPEAYEPSRGPVYQAALRADGSVVIPDEVRRLMELHGAESLELEVTFEGLILRPVIPGHDSSQWWLFTRAWRGRDEAAEQIGTGPLSLDDFEKVLASIDAELDSESR